MSTDDDKLLRLITSLWASAILFSLFAVPEWFDYVFLVQEIPAFVEIGLSFVALFALFRPTRPNFILLLVAQIGEVCFSMPSVPNHRTAMTFVSVGFLVSYLLAAKREKRFDLHSKVFFDDAIRVARMSLLIVYFFAAFAKMNAAYLDPSLSCAVRFYANVVKWFPFIPEGKAFNYLSIYGPLVVEILIPFGLLSKRFRKHSILLGIAFHFVLALDLDKRFLNFSMVMSALYFLFLSPTYLKNVEEKWREKYLQYLPHAFFIIYVVGFLQSQTLNLRILTIIAEQILWTMFIAGFVIAVYKSPSGRDDFKGEGEHAKSYPLLRYLLYLLLFINGSSPYLGTKTRTSFNMYSNLRLEPDYSNHHFWPRSLDLFGNLSKPVKVIRLLPEKLHSSELKDGMLLTHFELSRFVALYHDKIESLEFEYEGRTHLVESNSPEMQDLQRSYPWFQRKFLIYRPLGKDVTNECIW